MSRRLLFFGSVFAFLSVALGAFGAHILKFRISPDMLAVYETGVHYQMFHALGMILVALLTDKIRSSLVTWAGWLLFLGIVLFSGSLYALAVTGMGFLGMITPFGGFAFLVGWILLAIAAIRMW